MELMSKFCVHCGRCRKWKKTSHQPKIVCTFCNHWNELIHALKRVFHFWINTLFDEEIEERERRRETERAHVLNEIFCRKRNCDGKNCIMLNTVSKRNDQWREEYWFSMKLSSEDEKVKIIKLMNRVKLTSWEKRESTMRGYLLKHLLKQNEAAEIENDLWVWLSSSSFGSPSTFVDLFM